MEKDFVVVRYVDTDHRDVAGRDRLRSDDSIMYVKAVVWMMVLFMLLQSFVCWLDPLLRFHFTYF